MVTEVQSKMYIPGYYSMKDIGSNGGWALAHESGPLKTAQHHHHFGVYMATTDGVDYEKEKLRQTIVKHDSIFRQQVYELHRLYRKQRDLTSEIRSNHNKEEQTFRFSSGFRYEDDKGSRCASGFPTAGPPTFGRPRESEPMDLNKSKTPQRIPFDFDLEIPAVEEDVVEGDKKVGLITRRTLDLADLNEPIEIDDEVSGLCSDRNIEDEKIVSSEEKRQSHVYADMWSAAKQLSENRLVGKSEGIIGKIKAEIPSRTEDFRKPGESSEFLKAPVKRKIFGMEVAEGNNNNTNNSQSRIVHVADSEPSSTLTSAKSRSEVACRESHVISEVKTLPWLTIQDSSSTSESSNAKKILSFRRPQIDLNECFAEEEKEEEGEEEEEARFTGIDLEAPPPADDSDEEPEPEALAAAEALSAISLRFLADAISEAEDEKEEVFNVDVDDEFERIVLSLPEADREEERVYVAPPSPPRSESPPPPARRPRRGQGRRGRQRAKDFRSEVLPGMASLTRNEVTEDLQIIEGLVRATGGTWQSSLAVKNGGRGRRRGHVAAEVEAEVAVVVEVAGIEEAARLAGWGKRTRRPPRQRCPISNSLLPLKLT